MAPLYEVKLLNLVVNRHIHYSVYTNTSRDVCKNRVNIFGSFLDIRLNVECPRFFGPPGTFSKLADMPVLGDYALLQRFRLQQG